MITEKDQNPKDFFYENYNVFEFKHDGNVDLLEEAVKANTALKAKACFTYLVQEYLHHNRVSEDEAISVVKQNIGYYAGYYGNDVRERVEKLYDCEHPFFGKISIMGIPTSDEAYQCGLKGITLKELRANNNNLEKLEKDLFDLRESNKASWNMYGSELCAGDMIRQEEELEKKIAALKNRK